MSDEDLQKIKRLIQDEIHPIHGEIVKVKREVSDLKVEQFRTRSSLNKIETELARIDGTVEQLGDLVKETRSELKTEIKTVPDRVEAAVDWMGEEFGKVNIKLDILSDESQKNKQEITKIKDHLRLTSN